MYHGRFKGNHYNAGYKWGNLLYKNNKIISKQHTFKITEERRNFVKDCLPIYKKHYPEILEEIKGIADGQHDSYDNLCTFLLSMYCFEFDNHCTCFAFKDKNNIIFGRNSDFLVELEKLYMNCLYDLDNVYSFNGNTTAFVEMEDGINEYGLSVGLTFIYPTIIKAGFNAGLLVRYLLEKCRTTNEAIQTLKQIPIASQQTLTIADNTGNIAVVECNAENVEVIKANEKDNFSFDLAKDILSGKYGFMCQYDRKTNADTVWSVIYDIKNKKVYRVEGNPSRKNFKEDLRLKLNYEN